MKKLFGASLPAWAITTISILSLVYVLVMGGNDTKEVIFNDVSYQIEMRMPEGILDLIDDCKLKNAGDHCTVDFMQKITRISPAKETIIESKDEIVESSDEVIEVQD